MGSGGRRPDGAKSAAPPSREGGGPAAFAGPDPRAVMDPRVNESTIAHTPHAFINKAGEVIVIVPLQPRHEEGLRAMYLAYEPKRSFWGLPPESPDLCRSWVSGMIAEGLNLVALAMEAGVVGHAALFEMNPETCEMLLVVAPAFQNLGIGTQLARSAIQLAHEIGLRRIWLTVEARNLRARHVLRKCGFVYLDRSHPDEVEMALDVGGRFDPSKTRVAVVMTRRVHTAHPDMPCRAAVEVFLREPIGAMPVVDEGGRVVGIVSQTDLLLPACEAKRVGEVMTRPVVTVDEDCPLARVITLLRSRRVRCIPVLDPQGRLAGVVGRKDILAYYAGQSPGEAESPGTDSPG